MDTLDRAMPTARPDRPAVTDLGWRALGVVAGTLTAISLRLVAAVYDRIHDRCR